MRVVRFPALEAGRALSIMSSHKLGVGVSVIGQAGTTATGLDTEEPDWRLPDRRYGRRRATAANLLKPRYSSAFQTGLSACSRVQYLVCALFAQPQKRPWRRSAPSSSQSLWWR
jgi:hypothetical protein